MTKIIVNSNGERERILPPEGTHIARCFSILHTGTQKPIKEGYSPKNVVRVSWELSDEKAVFKEGEGEKPFVVSKQYNMVLNEKATLRKDLENWRGKKFTAEELAGFDISKLINVPCMVSVIHKQIENGTVYANVTNVTSPPKSVTVPPLENKTVLFSVLDFNKDIFDTLPEFIKNEIMASKEMQNKDEEQQENQDEEQQETDDLPF